MEIKSNESQSDKSGDRPIQIGSHYHFYEVNEALKFNRSVAIGQHLNIPAGTAVRFEPGDEKTIELVPYSGNKKYMDLKIKWMAIFNLTQKEGDSMSFKMSRKQYADLYGPTTGDSIRLADTQLFAHVDRNATVYGDEAVFGGGKSIRDGMGQNSQLTREQGLWMLLLRMQLLLIIREYIKRILV